MRRSLSLLLSSLLVATALLFGPQASWAYPFWAQQNYDNPREATGKLVCANCHLAKKATLAEVPQAVFPDTVFKAVVEIPYDTSVQQVAGDGSRTGLNVGAVVMLPDGFTLAPRIGSVTSSRKKPRAFITPNTVIVSQTFSWWVRCPATSTEKLFSRFSPPIPQLMPPFISVSIKSTLVVIAAAAK